MCEVQPEWNVREDHSERAGTLFVLIASREGKQQPLLPRCFLSIFYVFLSWLLSRMNITLFYPSSWIICSIWGEGRGGEGGRQAGRRQSGEHRFRPCWKSIMWLPFTTCLTPESWTQPFIPQRMTQCECDRVNTAVKKKKKKAHVHDWEEIRLHGKKERSLFVCSKLYWRLPLWIHREKLFLQQLSTV